MSGKKAIVLKCLTVDLDYVLGRYCLTVRGEVKDGPAGTTGRWAKGRIYDIEEAKALRDLLSARIREAEHGGIDPEHEWDVQPMAFPDPATPEGPDA